MAAVQTLPGLTRETVEQLSRSRDEPAWLLERRLHGWNVFEALPMPGKKDEDWRYTDVSKLDLARLAPFASASRERVDSPLRLDASSSGLLTHQNSETLDLFLPAHVAEQGVIFSDLDAAVREHPDLVRQYFMTDAVTPEFNKFAALNAALWTGGTFLYVPRDVDVALPLRTLYTLTAGGMSLFTHTLVVLEEAARVGFVEEYASNDLDELSLNAGVVEIIVKQAAHATFITLQEWNANVLEISTQRAVVDRDATLDWLVIGLGAGRTRANIEAALRGRGASAQMLGILWGHGKQHTDYHTLQDHIAPNTTSDLLYKAALNDESRSIFSGRIRVEKGAQGTDAYQTNRSLLLSDKASAYPSPNLEIEANEVRCSHGASVGKVDKDQLFYLMARGIPREQATRMIVEGFFGDVLQREPVEAIRDNLAELIARKMDSSA
ncbi:MAG: Fe-S cluster assembly protein SufD [Chloroflexota bacterium]|nr:MAG: Fe-S cluster assembly protein SufD [Chloroflexota bacterium]